jgi:hypothetical protein
MRSHDVPAVRLALGTSFHLALSLSVNASATAAEINAKAFAAIWKLASTTKIVLTA